MTSRVSSVPHAGSQARLLRQHGCRTPNIATRERRAGKAIHPARDSTAGAVRLREVISFIADRLYARDQPGQLQPTPWLVSTAAAAAVLPHSKRCNTARRAGKDTHPARDGTIDDRQRCSLPYRHDMLSLAIGKRSVACVTVR